MAVTLTGSELIVVYPIAPLTPYEATPDGFPVVSPEIVTLTELVGAGGGGYSSQLIVNSGVTATTDVTGIFIGWNSADTAEKTQVIPASIGSLRVITVSDLAGTAGTYPITIVPASGPPIIGNQDQVYINFMTASWIDTEAGWVAI